MPRFHKEGRDVPRRWPQVLNSFKKYFLSYSFLFYLKTERLGGRQEKDLSSANSPLPTYPPPNACNSHGKTMLKLRSLGLNPGLPPPIPPAPPWAAGTAGMLARRWIGSGAETGTKHSRPSSSLTATPSTHHPHPQTQNSLQFRILAEIYANLLSKCVG